MRYRDNAAGFPKEARSHSRADARVNLGGPDAGTPRRAMTGFLVIRGFYRATRAAAASLQGKTIEGSGRASFFDLPS
jgi:hypothetical protein